MNLLITLDLLSKHLNHLLYVRQPIIPDFHYTSLPSQAIFMSSILTKLWLKNYVMFFTIFPDFPAWRKGKKIQFH